MENEEVLRTFFLFKNLRKKYHIASKLFCEMLAKNLSNPTKEICITFQMCIKS